MSDERVVVEVESGCRVHRRTLTPSEYVLIEKVDGEWPQRALDVLGHDVAMLAKCEPDEILDALAAVAGKDT